MSAIVTVSCFGCNSEVKVAESQTMAVCQSCNEELEILTKGIDCPHPVYISGEVASCEDITRVVEYLEKKEGCELKYTVTKNQAEVYDPETGITVACFSLDTEWDLFSNIEIDIE